MSKRLQRRLGWLVLVLALALVAPILPALGASASEPTVAPTLSPPTGQCAVKSGNEPVTFGGTATPGSTVKRVYLKDLDENGAQIGDLRDITARDAVQVTDDGTIVGSTAAGPFNDPSRVVEIRAVMIVTKEGVDSATGESSGTSTRFDNVQPRYIGAHTVDTRAVAAEFSEPVSAPEGDFGPDWLVNGTQAILISGAEASRTVTMLQAIGEDAEPILRYKPVPTHGGYEDCAGNLLAIGNQIPQHTALDRIPPVIPMIESISGADASAEIFSNSASPTVLVSGLTSGHTAELYLESSETPSFDPEDDQLLATAVANGDGEASFDTLTPLTADGSYTFYAAAVDVHQNRSRDGGGNDGADDARYTLDRVAPLAAGASATGDKITVTFSEALTGADNPAEWTVTGCVGTCSVASITGSGDTRILQMNSGAIVPTGAEVTWADQGGSPYVDRAGNVLLPFSELTVEGLIPTTIDIEPESGAQAVASDYTLEITVTDDSGTPVPGAAVGLRAISGPASEGDEPLAMTCSSQSDGTCSFTYHSDAVGTDRIQAWLGNSAPAPEPAGQSGTADQDVVTVDWTLEGADVTVDATPESGESSIDDPQTITATVEDLGSPLGIGAHTKIENVNVDVRSLEGPNAGWVGECYTSSDGTCVIDLESQDLGDDTLQVWIDQDRDNSPKNDLFIDNAETLEADGLPLVDDPAQDTVERTWRESATKKGRILTVRKPARGVIYGSVATLGGTLEGDPICTKELTIQSRDSRGSFRSLKIVRPNAAGDWAYSFTPSKNARYRAFAAEDEHCQAAWTEAVLVGVHSKVIARARRISTGSTSCFAIKGSVQPYKTGKVRLERKRGGEWTFVKKQRLNRSRFNFPRCFSSAQKAVFRIKTPATRSYLNGTSKPLVVGIVRKPTV